MASPGELTIVVLGLNPNCRGVECVLPEAGNTIRRPLSVQGSSLAYVHDTAAEAIRSRGCETTLMRARKRMRAGKAIGDIRFDGLLQHGDLDTADISQECILLEDWGQGGDELQGRPRRHGKHDQVSPANRSSGGVGEISDGRGFQRQNPFATLRRKPYDA